MNLFTLTSNNTTEPRRWFYRLVMLMATSLLLVALVNAWVDPLFQYSYRSEHIPHLKQSSSKLLPGLLKHYPHNGIVLGTSMVENMRPSMVREYRGYHVINSRLSGGSAAKQGEVLRYAIRAGGVEYVLWGLDLFAFAGPVHRGAGELPQYLYNDYRGDDYLYLFNWDVLKSSIKTLLGHSFDLWPEYFDMDMITYREAKHGYSYQATLKTWQKGDFNADYSAQNYNFDILKSSYERHFRAVIKNNPQTHFDIIFPPYSILAWKDIETKGWLQSALDFKAYVIKDLLEQPQVAIYDFQADTSLSMNFSHYKDQTHYSPAISRLLLASMSADQYRIRTRQQLVLNITLLESQTKNYNMTAFLDRQLKHGGSPTVISPAREH